MNVLPTWFQTIRSTSKNECVSKKGTGSRDRFEIVWQKSTDLGPYKEAEGLAYVYPPKKYVGVKFVKFRRQVESKAMMLIRKQDNG